MRDGRGMGSRPALTFTVCLRDDDTRTFEFRTTHDAQAIIDLVAAAVRRGRKLHCYLLAANPNGPQREERYLLAKGYSRAPVKR